MTRADMKVEAVVPEEKKASSSRMEDTNLILLSGVIYYPAILYFTGNIYSGLAVLVLSLIF